MSAAAEVIRLGQEQQPVVVVDDFFPLADKLLEDAALREFRAIGPYYPGVRSEVPAPYLKFVVESLDAVIRDVFSYSGVPIVEESMYSLLTQPPSALQPIQLFPHYDGVDGSKLAVLHYLCGPEKGGTDFYQHCATGFETVNAERYARFKAVFEQEIREQGVPDPAYISGDTPLFKHLHRVEARFNRLIIYRGINLHSAFVPNDLDFSATPHTGRLTVNTFLNREPA